MTYSDKIAELHRRDPDRIFYNYVTQFYWQLERVAAFHSADELLGITTDLATFNNFLDMLPNSSEKAKLREIAGKSDHHFKAVQLEARICLHRISQMEGLFCSN